MAAAVRLARLSLNCGCRVFARHASYVQGQCMDGRTREYFYYVDHHGQLFLDGTKMMNFVTCFKDPEFLTFFFKRVKLNNSERYQEHFPFVSPCGIELNFIRCEDLPVVFTHLINMNTMDTIAVEKKTDWSEPFLEDNPHKKLVHEQFGLSFGGATSALTDLTVPFQPCSLIMDQHNGRIYHPGPEKAGGVGLVKSSLALQLSKCFVVPHTGDSVGESGNSGDSEVLFPRPSHFVWNGVEYTLEYPPHLLDKLKQLHGANCGADRDVTIVPNEP